MKHNLLEIFDKEVKPVLFDELKRENPPDDMVIYQHLTIIHASILGGLIKKSKKPNGAKAIKNLIEKGSHTGEIIDRASTIFGQDQELSEIKKLGNSLLTFVFDEGADKAFEKIQHFLSEKYLTTEEELIEVNRMVAPFSIGLIGRIIHDEKMQEKQVAEFLVENEPIIGMRFPGLAKVLGIQAVPASTSVENSSTTEASPAEGDFSDPAKEEENEIATDIEKNEDQDRIFFLKSLWPWVALLVVSGLSLFILKQFEDKPVESTVSQDNPFNFIQRDSLMVNNQKSYTLPGNVPLEIKRNSSLDSLLYQLENNQGFLDTLRYINPDIRFQDSTAVLTASANKELANIILILQSYTHLKMDLNLIYNKNQLDQNPDISEQQVKNLRDYFTVFGLDGSRFKINKYTHPVPPATPGSDNPDTDTLVTEQPMQLTKDKIVELLFYNIQQIKPDSVNIENN